MKIAIKSFFLILVFISFFSISYSQLKGFSLGPYIERAWPTGEFHQTHLNGIGAGLNADIKLPGKLGLTGSAGYIHFSGKKTEAAGKHQTVSAVPLRAGLKYRPLPLIYFKLEGGIAKSTTGDNSPLIFTPGAGIRILGLDVQGKYEHWMGESSKSFWALKLGYNF